MCALNPTFAGTAIAKLTLMGKNTNLLGKSWVQIPLAFVVVLAIQTWGIATPSLWADEVATISASTRSLGHLFSMLQVIDAVHGTYYLLMHFWAKVFGLAPFWLRLPSAIAVTGAVVLTWRVARSQFGARVGWFALVLAAALPRLTWAATEGRSYGIDALIGITILYLFLKANQATGRRALGYWIAYAIFLSFGIDLFIYMVLFAGAHGIWLLRKNRDAFGNWLYATIAAVLGSLVVIVWGLIEKGQLGWLPKLSDRTILEVFVGQAFWLDPALALLACGLILALMVGARRPGFVEDPQETNIIGLLTISVVLPPAIILAYSAFGDSVYDSRYFTYAAPMVAVLLALAIDRLFTRRLALLALIVAVALSVQPYVYFRTPESKLTSWGPLAAKVEAVSHSGDGILYSDFKSISPSLSRVAIGYPEEFLKVHDLTQTAAYYNSPGLYPKRLPIDDVVVQLPSYKRILVLGASKFQANYQHISDLLTTNGFSIKRQIKVADYWISVFTLDKP
ncbi:MAG: hypothetical protein RL508_798 [Actinomycetota bacterium]